MRRHAIWRIGFAVLLCCSSLLASFPFASAPVAQAGFLGRHTFFGKVFRATPLGRVVMTFEDRRDAYRSAEAWLAQSQQSAVQRAADLRRGFQTGTIDARTYIHASATNTRHAQQYEEVSQRMKAIGHDNFNRGIAQQVMEVVMPRVVGAELFSKTVGELQNVLQTGQAALEGGVQGIQALANKAYPDFMREGRADIQKAIQRLDESGLSGGPIAEIRSRLQMLDSRLGSLEKRIPEAIKPDEVKQLQEEAITAANGLKAAQEALAKGVARLRDKATVYFPQRSVLKDTVIKEKMAEFSADLSAVSRAAEETRLRRALGPRLDEAMARAGIDPSDPLYTRIRQRALSKFDPANDEVSDADLTGMCTDAAKEIRAGAEQPRLFGTASLSAGLADLKPLLGDAAGVGGIAWQFFQYDIPPNDQQHVLACWQTYPNLLFGDLAIALSFDLDTGELSGTWSGTGCCQRYEDVQADGAFEGAMTGGKLTIDEDGKGFTLDGDGYTTVTINATSDCQVTKQGTRSGTIPTSVQARWRAGEGDLRLVGRDDSSNLGFSLAAANPPFELSSQ